MNRESFFNALGNGAIALTANNRLARHLRCGFDQHQVKQGLVTWVSPQILPINTWFMQCFENLQAELQTNSGLISPLQQHYIWSDIIKRSCEDFPLLNTSETETMVQAAWSISNDWKFPDNYPEDLLSNDQMQFIKWSDEYRDYCKHHELIDGAALPEFIFSNLHKIASLIPKQIVLAGFHRLTLRQQELMEEFRSMGVEVDTLESEPFKKQKISKVSPKNDDNELEMAANWARDSLKQNPNQLVGIIISDLQSRKHAIAYHLNKALYAKLSPQQISQKPDLYNISLGRPVNSIAPAVSSMLVLKLTISRLNNTELTQLLLSDYITGAGTEYMQRAVLDSKNLVRQRKKHLAVGFT